MLELKKKNVNLDEVAEEEGTESKKINKKKVAIAVGIGLAVVTVIAIACGLKDKADPEEDLAGVIDITDFNVADDE